MINIIKKNKALQNQALLAKEDVIIQCLAREWEVAEREMKKHELRQKAKVYGKEVVKILLKLLVISGVITIGAIAPNIFAAFGRLNEQRRFFEKSDLKQLYKAKEKGLLKFEKIGENQYRVYATEKGKLKGLGEVINDLKIKKPAAWAAKWRVIISDIPRKHNVIRNVLRQRLKTLGFYPLQKSVFICPFPCAEEVKLLAYLYNASPYLHIIEADSISDLNIEKMSVWFGIKI